jgi:hypothetical protein
MCESLKEFENLLGLEFVEALKKVLNVRKNKRLQYGDAYLNDDILFLKFQIENKLKRLTIQFENNKLKNGLVHEETAIDSLIDLANYAIFMIAVINKKS